MRTGTNATKTIEATEAYIKRRWPNCEPFWEVKSWGPYAQFRAPKVDAFIFPDAIVINRNESYPSIEEYCAKTTFADDMDRLAEWLKVAKPDFNRANCGVRYPFAALYYNLEKHKDWTEYKHPVLPSINHFNSDAMEEYFKRHTMQYMLNNLAMPIRDEICEYL